MTELATLVAAGAGLTVAMVVLGAARLVASPADRVRGRMAALEDRAGQSVFAADVSVLRDRRASSFGPLDALLRRSEWTERTRLMLERAGLPFRVGEYLMLRALVGGGMAVLALVAAPLVGAGSAATAMVLAGFVVGWFLVPLYVSRRISKRAEALEGQVVQLCELMASMLSSGFGYMQALISTAQQLDPPMSTEMQRLVDTVQLGGDVDEALIEMSERLNSADFDIVVTAITIQRSSGGNLADILTGVASTMRDRQTFKLELKALTSRERYTAWILVLFPFGLGALMMFLAPDPYLRLITDSTARIILAAAIFLDVIGLIVIKRLMKVEY